MRKKRDGEQLPLLPKSRWTSHGKGKLDRYDEHESGWQVIHCGHPTANWPWYAVSPEGEHVVAHHGRGWRKLEQAREHVDGLIGGTWRVSYQYESYSGRQRFGRVVPRCYECNEAATGRAIPGGHPTTPDVPACDRHRWLELGVHPMRRMSAKEIADHEAKESRRVRRVARA